MSETGKGQEKLVRCCLEVEWGETPFAVRYPAPLVRIERDGYGDVDVPESLVERFEKAEREYLACQEELQAVAREAGELDWPSVP